MFWKTAIVRLLPLLCSRRCLQMGMFGRCEAYSVKIKNEPKYMFFITLPKKNSLNRLGWSAVLVQFRVSKIYRLCRDSYLHHNQPQAIQRRMVVFHIAALVFGILRFTIKELFVQSAAPSQYHIFFWNFNTVLILNSHAMKTHFFRKNDLPLLNITSQQFCLR